MFLILRFIEDAAGDLDARNVGLGRRRGEIPRELGMALRPATELLNRSTEVAHQSRRGIVNMTDLML